MVSLRVYLSGKMSGEPLFNFPAFHAAAHRLRGRGYEVISPAEMAGEAADAREYADLLTGCILTIASGNVDAIVVLEGWEQSGGARAEVAFARALGLPVVSYPGLKPVPLQTELTGNGETLNSDCSNSRIRQFETGATRDLDDRKPDYEAFLSPLVIREFGAYMHRHRVQADGSLRSGDNWQKGMPLDAYMKSLWRHVLDAWTLHRGLPATDYDGNPVDLKEALCAVLFNVQGYLHELAKPDAVPTA